MIIFPDTPYGALWSASTCRQLAQYSAVLCFVDIPFFSLSICRSRKRSRSHLFPYIDARSSFFHFIGSFIATKYFYYLPQQELSLSSATLFGFLFFIQGVLMYAALPAEDKNMVDNDYSPLSLKENWHEDASGGPCNWRKGIWWIGTALYFLGSWGLWIAFAMNLMVYHLSFSGLDWLLFILFYQ
jgi:hypothetical protein